MMSMGSRRELVAVVARRYAKAKRREKGRILDEFVENTGYHRKYATALLNHPPPVRRRVRKRSRRRRYGVKVRRALACAWKAANGICAKRLVPFLPELVAVLERHSHLNLDQSTRALLLSISPATADRLLQTERRRLQRRGLGTTKPGTLLKHQVPVRTFADWDKGVPGFVEVDLVAHCGESTRGEYLHTLILTDVCTGWTDCLALLNRSQQTVSQAIERARRLLPFPLLGLDTDNGSEFLNHNLLRYCRQKEITFTRCRPYKKNDQCYVEQKNWSIVRQLVGYDRYEGQDACRRMDALYQLVRLYVNLFQPSMKLVAKKRKGARVTKRYDRAETPYQRALACGGLYRDTDRLLQAQYTALDPLAVLRKIRTLQNALWKHAK